MIQVEDLQGGKGVDKSLNIPRALWQQGGNGKHLHANTSLFGRRQNQYNKKGFEIQNNWK